MANNQYTFRHFLWLPIPLFLAAIFALWAADLSTVYESSAVLITLNVFFSMLVSLFAAALCTRSFLVSAEPAMAALGCGLLAWGTTSGLAAMAVAHSSNTGETIYNLGLLVCGLCSFTGAILSSRTRWTVRMPIHWLIGGYSTVLTLVALITVVAYEEWLPLLFAQGQAGSLIRQFVLGSAISMFVVTAFVMWRTQMRTPSPFLRWYAPGLALLATGLTGLLLQSAVGSLLGWVSRAAQYFAGIYLLIAGIIAVRETKIWAISLAAALRDSEELSRKTLQVANDSLIDSRRAALNLMDDALSARAQVEQSNNQLRSSEERYRSLFNGMTEGFAIHEIITDAQDTPVDYRFLDVNPAFERMTGLKREQVVGKTHNEVLPDDDPKWLRMCGTVAITGESVQFDDYSPLLKRHYEVFAYRPAPKQFAVLFVDISEHKRAEERIARLTSLYTVLSRVNAVIVRTHCEEDLYAEVCRIIFEECQYPLIWIGEVLEREVMPIAAAGSALEYLDDIKVEIDGLRGQGPTGTAIREGKAVINDDFTVNPSTSPWRASALKQGFLASAAFPLRRQGQPMGALTLYASISGAFDTEKVRLLEALGADISFALDNMAQEQARAEAEHALRKAHGQAVWLAQLPGENPDPILRVGFDGKVLYSNAAATERIGWQYKKGDVLEAALLRSLVEQAVLQEQRVEHDLELAGRLYAVTVAPFPKEHYANLYGRDVTEQRRAEQREREAVALAAASRTAVDVLDAMGEGVLLLDMQGRIVSVNPALEKMMRIPSAKIIGHDLGDWLSEFLSPEDGTISRNALDNALKGQIPTLPPLTILSRTGFRVPVIPSVTFVYGPRRQPTEIVVTLRDISELRAMSQSLVESERKYRELVENANSIIMRVTPDHTITFFNEYAQTFFGYSADEVIGTNVVDTIAPEIDSKGCDLADMMRKITACPELYGNSDNENVCKDGRRVWVHWANRGVRDEMENLIEILCVGTDITKRKELEAEAARYQKRLQELAERLTTSEEEDRWRISRYIHDTIIQNLSLSNIKLGALRDALTQAKMDEELSKLNATRTLIEKAAAECRSVMSDLTPALLYDLGLIPALRDFADKVHEQHSVRIHVDESGEDIPLDAALRGLLFQSTRELVMNALKYAEQSDIRISVERQHNQIAIQVQDKGRGFDSSKLNRRGDGHGGFGLFSVRERVEGLGGRLEIESASGQGTTARIVVPISSSC